MKSGNRPEGGFPYLFYSLFLISSTIQDPDLLEPILLKYLLFLIWQVSVRSAFEKHPAVRLMIVLNAQDLFSAEKELLF